MRYHVLRFDVWVCLALSFFLGMGLSKILENFLSKQYIEYQEEHKVSNGEVGGVANESVYRAQDVEDLLSHDLFTVVSNGIQYKNRGAGYYHGMYLNALTLPSSELVAARINADSVVATGEDIFTGDNILPVGRIVMADLTDDTYFIEQIEYKEKLSRTNFYIDMVGNAEIASDETYIDLPVLVVQLLTVLVAFPIFHMIGSKMGLFPYFFEPRT